MESSAKNVTQLLLDWGQGRKEAMEELLPRVYDELRRLAAGYLRRERPDHTLQATALVHEAYLRMVDQSQVAWQSRTHFFGIAARLMRQILVNHALKNKRDRRGGGYKVSLVEAMDVAKKPAMDVLALDDALKRLAEVDPEQSRLVELRYFGGLTIVETAELLGVSPATVKREWNVARAWLHCEMRGEPPEG